MSKATVSASSSTLAAWTEAMNRACSASASASSMIFGLVLSAREQGFDPAEVRKVIKDAVLAAGGTDATARQRACEAGAVLAYEGDTAVLPNNLQMAYSAINRAKKEAKGSGKEPKQVDTRGQKQDAIKALLLALDRVKGLATNPTTLALLGDITDLAQDIAESVEFAAKPAPKTTAAAGKKPDLVLPAAPKKPAAQAKRAPSVMGAAA